MNNKKLASIISLAMFTGIISVQKVHSAEAPKSTFFKCTNAQGAVFYKDKPCAKKHKEKKIKVSKAPKPTVKKRRLAPSKPLLTVAQQEERDYQRNGYIASTSEEENEVERIIKEQKLMNQEPPKGFSRPYIKR